MVGCSPIIDTMFEFNGLPVIPAEVGSQGARYGNRPSRLGSRLRGNDGQRSGDRLSGFRGRSSPPFPPMRHQSSNARSSRFRTLSVTKVQSRTPAASPKFRSHAESARMAASPKFKVQTLAARPDAIGRHQGSGGPVPQSRSAAAESIANRAGLAGNMAQDAMTTSEGRIGGGDRVHQDGDGIGTHRPVRGGTLCRNPPRLYRMTGGGGHAGAIVVATRCALH
ncbi:hypothetical protein A6A40_14825 [Azospirillum humicireducens]|uniref:Uncharacterized protein n=1 Tax=Azospirillum humicireducens TaxID=1226968 RepID=A0A2R4VPL7_9PROT|nr:hypothetical protein A6A40_14825 [Azospirillum humicireducens]